MPHREEIERLTLILTIDGREVGSLEVDEGYEIEGGLTDVTTDDEPEGVRVLMLTRVTADNEED